MGLQPQITQTQGEGDKWGYSLFPIDPRRALSPLAFEIGGEMIGV